MILKRRDLAKLREKEAQKNGNKCLLLGVDLGKCQAVSACLDHDHTIPDGTTTNAGRIRSTISMAANTFLGRVEKYWNKYCKNHTHLTLPQVLRNMADYLENDYSHNPYHYIEIDKWKKRAKRYRVATLLSKLENKGLTPKELKGQKKEELVTLFMLHCVMPLYEEEE